MNRVTRHFGPLGLLQETEIESPEHVRDHLVDYILAYLAVMGIPAVALSLARVVQIGWLNVYYLHIAALASIWIVFILRRKISTLVKVQFMTFLLLFLALGSLLEFGLVGSGILYLSIVSIFVTVFFGLRMGLAAVGLAVLVTCVFMLAHSYGWINYNISPLYTQSTLRWIIGVTDLLIFTGAIIVILGVIQEALNRSLSNLKERKADLEQINKALLAEMLEHENAEERFQTVFDQAAVGIALISPEGRYLQVNPRMCSITGYERDELLGKQFHDIVHPEDADSARARLKNLLDGSIDSAYVQKRYIHKNGSIIWTNSYITLVRDNEQKPLYFITVAEDTTYHIRMEEDKQRFYRDTIYSVTDGKLRIVSPEEIRPYIDSAELRMEINIPVEIADARQRIEEYCRSKGLYGDNLALFVSGILEAMNNAYKHAGGGLVFAGIDDGNLWAGVSDTGPGIGALTLPRATLRRGYSTKTSIGMGYAIMLGVSDYVLLNTGPEGTQVVLIKSTVETKPAVSLDELPDTWDTIGHI